MVSDLIGSRGHLRSSLPRCRHRSFASTEGSSTRNLNEIGVRFWTWRSFPRTARARQFGETVEALRSFRREMLPRATEAHDVEAVRLRALHVPRFNRRDLSQWRLRHTRCAARQPWENS